MRDLFGFRNFLVTGGAGFIGSHIVDELVSHGCRVKVLDSFSNGLMSNLSRSRTTKRLRVMTGDIADPRAVAKAVAGVDVVYHEAAIVSAVQSIRDPVRSSRTNVVGTIGLLEASRRARIQRFIYASSSSVYGQAKGAVTENSALAALNPYAASKLAAEQYCMAYFRCYGFPAISLRYFNVVGPRQRYGPYTGVVKIFADRLKKGKQPIIHGTGSQTRDFVSVKDVVRANISCLSCESATGRALNIGSGTSISIYRLAKLMTKLAGIPKFSPIYAPARQGDIHHSRADIRLAHELIGFHPTVSLRTMLEEVMASGDQEDEPLRHP